MKRKPIKILVDKVGKKRLAAMLNVSLATIYLWLQRENGEKGRCPSLSKSVDLVKIAKRENVRSLTIEYLVRL